MPFIIAALVIVHIIALHEDGSNNPIGVDGNIDKDLFILIILLKMPLE